MKFSHQIRSRYSETDKMGVVYHSRFLEYFEEARVEALRSIGLSYAAIEQEGILLPVVKVEINYFSPAYYDELLTIEIELEKQDFKSSISFDCQSLNHKGQCLNKAKVVLACVSAKNFKPIPVPNFLREKLLQTQG